MSKHDITNLKRQISARRANGADKALQQCLGWSYRFTVRMVDAKGPGTAGPMYVLECAGVAVGSFIYFAKGSRPEAVLGQVWRKCGAGMPWEEEESEDQEREDGGLFVDY